MPRPAILAAAMERSTEQRVLAAMRKVLARIVREVTPEPGMRHPLSAKTICRVDPKFQCVVAIKMSELDRAPAPFLNRFEKYYITHKSILESVLRSLPVGLQSVIEAVYKKVMPNLLLVPICFF